MEQSDWGLLISFLPANWEDLARQTGALRKLRKDKSPGNLLRTLLLHLGCGQFAAEIGIELGGPVSLVETAAEVAGLAAGAVRGTVPA